MDINKSFRTRLAAMLLVAVLAMLGSPAWAASLKWKTMDIGYYTYDLYIDALAGTRTATVLGFNSASATRGAVNIPETVTATSSGTTYTFTVKAVAENAFADNTRITKVTIPSTVTKIPTTAFKGCTNVGEVNWRTTALLMYDHFLSAKTSLETLNTASESLGSRCFAGFTALTTFTGLDGMKKIDQEVFKGCTALTSITIPATVTSVDNYIGKTAFVGCTAVTSLKWNTSIFLSKNMTAPFTNIQSVVVNGNIDSNAFKNCTKLTSVTLGSDVKSIGASAFEGCKQLQLVAGTPALDGLGMSAFRGTSITNTSFLVNATITNIPQYCFADCRALTSSVTLPATVTGIGYGAFSNSRIRSVNLGNVNTISAAAFMNCADLTSISSLSTSTKTETIGDDAFHGCSGLTGSVTIPSSVKTLGKRVFEGCSSIARFVNNSSEVKTLSVGLLRNCTSLTSFAPGNAVEEIADSCFYGCSAMTSAGIPDGVKRVGVAAYVRSGITSATLPSSLESIGSNAFENTALSTLNIPSSLTAIGALAFSGCNSLKEVTATGSTAPSLGIDAFKSTLAVSARKLYIDYPWRNSYTSKSWNKYFTFVYPEPTDMALPQEVYNVMRDVIARVRPILVPSGANGQCTYTSSNEEVATITSVGDIVGKKTGECTITVTTVNGLTASAKVIVSDITDFTLSDTELALFAGMDHGKLTVKEVTPAAGSKSVTFDSSDEEVATVDAWGEITPLKAGVAIITATTPNGLKKQCKVTVRDVEQISLNLSSVSLSLPGSTKLTATSLPEGVKQGVTWSSSNPGVAIVDASGMVIALSGGIAEITATSHNGKTATCEVVVRPEVVKLNYTSLLLKPGEKYSSLKATIDGGVTWSSSNTSVATVDANTGAIQAYREGTAVITAQSKSFSYAKSTCLVTVSTVSDYVYVGNIYYLPIKDEEGNAMVTNMGFSLPSSYTDDVDRGEYSAIVQIPSQITSKDGITYNVTEIADYAFYRMKDLQSVIVPASVTKIGEKAFEGSKNLVSVAFASGSKLSTIGGRAFFGCTKLDNLTMPNSVTSVGPSVFQDCKGMHRVGISTGLTELSNSMFRGCSVLNNVVLPSGLTSISQNAFRECSVLDNVTLPAGIKVIENSVFRDCKGMTGIKLNSGLSMIDEYAFAGTESLGSIALPANMASLQAHAFQGSGLRSISIPASVQGVGADCFNSCKTLRAVSFAATRPISVGHSAFDGCAVLDSVDVASLSAWVETNFSNRQANPTTFSHRLYVNGAEQTNVELPYGTRNINQYALSGLSAVTSVTIPESVKAVSDAAFDQCTALAEINIQGQESPAFVGCRPYGFMALNGAKVNASETCQLDDYWMLANASATFLTDSLQLDRDYIVIGMGEEVRVSSPALQYFNLSSAYKAGFTKESDDCYIVKGLVPGLEMVDVKPAAYSMQKASRLMILVTSTPAVYVGNQFFTLHEDGTASFANLGTLSGKRNDYSGIVNIPDAVTYRGVTYPVRNVEASALSNMQNLQKAEIAAGVESIDASAFANCDMLKRISFAQDSKTQTISSNAFSTCRQLDHVVLPNSVTYVAPYAFAYCDGLHDIVLSDKMTEISSSTFYHCDVLDNIDLPSGILSIGAQAYCECVGLKTIKSLGSSLLTINEMAFQGCKKLTEVVLPSTVQALQDYVFVYCKELNAVTFSEDLRGLGKDLFTGCATLGKVSFRNNHPVLFGDSPFTDNYYAELSISDFKAWAESSFPTVAANPAYKASSVTDKDGKPITELVLPEGTRYINQNAFAYFKALEAITIPSTVTAVSDNIFYNCAKLADVTVNGTRVPDFIGSHALGNMANVFRFATLNVPEALREDYESDKYWGNYFVDGLISDPSEILLDRQALLLSASDREKVNVVSGEGVNWSFDAVSSLCSVDANGNVSSYLSSPTRLVLTAKPKSATGVKDAKLTVCYKAYGRKYLGNLAFIDNEDGSVSYTNYMGGASRTESRKSYEYGGILDLPATLPCNGQLLPVTTVGINAFADQLNLQKVYIPAGIEKLEVNAFTDSDIKDVEFERDSRMTEIASNAFSNCEQLRFALDLPDGIKSIGTWGFRNCSTLPTVKLPASLTSLGSSAFSECKKLDNISIPNGVTLIEKYTFSNCTSLSDISLSQRLSVIDEFAFQGCAALSQIELPASLTSIQNSVFAQAGLQSVAIPANVQGIGALCFQGCAKLKEATFACKEPMTVGESAFRGCDMLRHVGVDNMAAWVMTNFYDEEANPTCLSRAISVDGRTPDVITVPEDALYINKYAFINCDNLKCVELPSSIITVSDNIFKGCTNLTEVACHATAVPAFIGTDDLVGMSSVFSHATLYVPAASVDSYKNNKAYWAHYRQIVSLEDGGPDAIESILSDDSDAVKVYDLQGRRIPARQAKHGLYIVDGKKVVR